MTLYPFAMPRPEPSGPAPRSRFQLQHADYFLHERRAALARQQRFWRLRATLPRPAFFYCFAVLLALAAALALLAVLP